MFVNQLMAEAMMEMVEESKVHIRAQQQLINVFSDSVAKQQELAHMLMGAIRAELQIVTLLIVRFCSFICTGINL